MKRASQGAPAADSFVDALMLELVETDRGVRDNVTLAFTRLGEDACVALCAEVRDIEDDGGLWSVETKRRRTKGGVWFALLEARYPEAARAQKAAPALPPEPTSTVRQRARGASSGSPEVIVLRRRRGAL